MKTAGFVLLGILLLSTIGYAQELYQYEVDAEIKDNNVHIIQKFIFSKSGFNDFNFLIEGDPKNIKLPDLCKVEDRSAGKYVTCDISAKLLQNFDIFAEYDLVNGIDDLDDVRVFDQRFRTPANTKTMLILVKLPEGSGLIEENTTIAEHVYSPVDAIVSTDGRRTIMVWERKGLVTGDAIDITIYYERLGLFQDYSWIMSLQTGLIVLMIIAGYIIFKNISNKKHDIKVVLPVLKNDEKIIFERLLEHKGEANQKVLVRESNYSKGKVSKVLKSLEERGLVRLERLGRSNKVYLVKDFEKKEQKDLGNNQEK